MIRHVKAAVLLHVIAACATPQPLPTGPLAIDVVSWPSRPALDCFIAELPVAPEVQPWPEYESDINEVIRAGR